MSEIDIQNAKSIRDPMDIVVNFDAVDYDTSLSVGSSSYKVADFTTITDVYSMRSLADLQGDGFALDGTHVLYDATVAASEKEGKIGFRSNITGTPAINISSPEYFSTIMVSGATGISYITCDGVKYYANADGNYIIDTGTWRSASLTITKKNTTTRAEIQRIVAGLQMAFSNEDIISCQLNLRSDLKPIDPTLPESEIEIRAYYPQDISKIMSTIQDDKPITYKAGYGEDLSEERVFYLSEPATWKDGLLTIKGVDAVHKLDKETFPMFIGETRTGEYSTTVTGAFRRLYSVMVDQLYMSGMGNFKMEALPAESLDGSIAGNKVNSIIKRQTQRAVIANMMNLIRFDVSPYQFGLSSFWPTYVDAGIPSITWTKPTSKWDIYEADCGNVQREVARRIKKINYTGATVKSLGFYIVKTGGSAKAFKNSGLVMSYGDYTTYEAYVYEKETPSGYMIFDNTEYDDELDLPYYTRGIWSGSYRYGMALYDSDVGKNNQLDAMWWRTSYSWDSFMNSNWNTLVRYGVVEDNATTIDLSAEGRGFTVDERTMSVSRKGQGVEETASTTGWLGTFSAMNLQGNGTYTLLPTMGMQQVLNRSGETGSFTWKGDPRMQPRDVFTFHRLNGTAEECTIESISLKHEKGGTVAEITYRKGIV